MKSLGYKPQEKKLFSFEDIKKYIGPENTNSIIFITEDQLKHYHSLDQLISHGPCVILLAPPHAFTGHFICLLPFHDHIEHFDSYGYSVLKEIQFTQNPILQQILNTSHKKIIENKKRYQTMREDINTCGRWVVIRLLLQHYTLDEFDKLVSQYKPLSYDEIAVCLSFLLPFKK